jgi:uncharacterized membrane protein SpoIIM required for sporulation
VSGSEAAQGPAAREPVLRSAQFRREREHAWRELAELVARAEREGLASLTAGELNRLPSLYRGAASALAVTRAVSLDKNLLDYLTALVGRAYICVYAGRRPAARLLADFFRRRFPAAVRRHAVFLGAALAVLGLGVLAGFQLTSADPERYYSFVGEGMAGGCSPASSTAELRAVLYQRPASWPALLTLFASFLFTHNARIGILCFALGFAAGAPVPYLLFANGLALGAMAALYHSRGLGFEFWAWVLPHGVTELLAVCLCAAGGLALGTSLVFPGRHTRLENLRRGGREAALLAAGAVALFFAAALVEGFFRQLVQSPAVRAAVAGTSLVFWLGYFLLAGHEDEGT